MNRPDCYCFFVNLRFPDKNAIGANIIENKDATVIASDRRERVNLVYKQEIAASRLRAPRNDK